MKSQQSIFGWIIFLWIGVIHLGVAQVKIPEKPAFIPPVIDSVKVLSNQEYQHLYDKLKNYQDSTSTEILVMIVPSTHGEYINRYATDLGHKWKIGAKGKDNGIVLMVAINDRKVAIINGDGIEHLLTDALSKRIIENIIKPNFKQQNYFQGLDEATSVIIQILKGEYKNDEVKNEGSVVPLLIIIAVIILLIFISKGKKGGGI